MTSIFRQIVQTCFAAMLFAGLAHAQNPGIVSVLPPNGKETGNDLVTLTGGGFTNIGDTSVTIGPFAATVVFVDATHVRIRTARGFGLRDVTITNSFGTCTLPNSYQYLDPSIAARYGNVNVGDGDRFDVLSINGQVGDPALRELSIPVNTAVRVDLAAAPSKVRSRYALYVWPRTPNFATVRSEVLHGFDLGCMVLPSPLNAPDSPQPFKILNNTTIPEFGTPNINSFPAPVTVGQRPNGLHSVRTLTLQGFIEDDLSQAPAVNIAITNAIILHVTP